MSKNSSWLITGLTFVATLGGLLFGYDTAVISGVTHALRDVYQLSDAGLGAAVSAALWGTLLGALVMGSPGDRFGTRNTLRFIGALYFVSALGCALAWSLSAFVVFRFLAGIAIGGSSVLAPVYLAEIVPAPPLRIFSSRNDSLPTNTSKAVRAGRAVSANASRKVLVLFQSPELSFIPAIAFG